MTIPWVPPSRYRMLTTATGAEVSDRAAVRDSESSMICLAVATGRPGLRGAEILRRTASVLSAIDGAPAAATTGHRRSRPFSYSHVASFSPGMPGIMAPGRWRRACPRV